MTSLAVSNPYKNAAAELQRRQDAIAAARADIKTAAAAQAASARAAASDASTFARGAVATSWFGLRTTGQGAKSAAAGAAMAGAAAGFAVAGAAGWVAGGVASGVKRVLGGLARGLLSVSNFLAPAGQKAVMAPVVAKKEPSFKERMFAKAREKLDASKASFATSGTQFKTAAMVGVLGTTANLALAGYTGGIAAGRYAKAGAISASGAALWSAGAGFGVARTAVEQAEKGADSASAAALRAATVLGRPAGLLPANQPA